MENLLRKYYKGRNLTREEIFSLYNEKSLTIELEELKIKEPLENIPVKGYVHIDYNNSHRLVYHKGCCFIYKIANIINAPEYTLQEIIKIKGEYIVNVMVLSKSIIGKLLYGTLAKKSVDAVTLQDCVEIDFLEYLDEPNLGVLASDIESLKKCRISPVIPEVNSFDVIFVFSCSEEVQQFLDARIANKNNNELDEKILKDLCHNKNQKQ